MEQLKRVDKEATGDAICKNFIPWSIFYGHFSIQYNRFEVGSKYRTVKASEADQMVLALKLVLFIFGSLLNFESNFHLEDQHF